MSMRIPSLDELARALYELEPHTATWYEFLDATTRDSGIAARAELHNLRGQARRLGIHLFADPLPAPRPPLGVEWRPVPHDEVLAAIKALLPGFEMSVYEGGSPMFATMIKLRRRVEMGGVSMDDYVLMDDERIGATIVEFAREMRADAIAAYGLTAAFEAEWDRARHEARAQTIALVLQFIESTRVWVEPEGDIDDESGYLAPLTPEMATLAARIKGAD